MIVTPGVYIEETGPPPRPIEGVPTSTAAFLGETSRGPVTPTLVTSFTEFAREFGDATGLSADSYLPFCVRGFFDNGGRRLYICRVVASNQGGPPTVADYAGAVSPGLREAPQGLSAIDAAAYAEIALVYAPYPRSTPWPGGLDADAIARAVVAHCEQHRFRFAIIDLAPETPGPLTPQPRATIADTSFAACYHPWLTVTDPSGAASIPVPPGGHVAGLFARVDIERGVFKAPANDVLRGIAGLMASIDDAGQEPLARAGINAIRSFPGRGIRAWGGRTLSSDPGWRYVSIRRLFIFLEHSIATGLEWTAFEPHGERLWARVRDTVRLFLRAQWIAGGLVGRTEDEAFFIKVDRTTMTQDDIDNGRLIVLIGIAAVRPAEFVIFRIGAWTCRTCE